jgi:hypothetical protein
MGIRIFASCMVLTKASGYANLLAPFGSTHLSRQIVHPATLDVAGRTGANRPPAIEA